MTGTTTDRISEREGKRVPNYPYRLSESQERLKENNYGEKEA